MSGDGEWASPSSCLCSRRSQVIGRIKEGPPLECMDTQVSTETAPEPASAPRQGRAERRYLANRPVNVLFV